MFDPEPPIDPMSIVKLMQKEPKTYQLGGQDTLRFTAQLDDTERRFGFVEGLLETLNK